MLDGKAEEQSSVEAEDMSYREHLVDIKAIINRGLAEVESSRQKRNIMSLFMIVAGMSLLAISLIWNNAWIDALALRESLMIISVILLACGIGSLVCSVAYKNPGILLLEGYLSEANEELELLDIEEEQHEKRAEVRFKNHQKEIKRYYDINLSHLKVVFPLGIGIIVFGSAVIIISIVIFRDIAQENIMPITIGVISGLLIDFIGAIFIRMYIETVKASTKFHNQLVYSNNNLFANVLVTKISDEKLRNETFAEMAKLISSTNKEIS